MNKDMDQQPLNRPESLTVTARKVDFDFERAGFDRHWHRGNPIISHFWSSLSQAFGPGEKFFIDSVRALRTEVSDPALLDEMEMFTRQEAHHTLQHRKFNRMVGALGYDVERMEARYARPLAWCRDHLEPMEMLSVTMALEHFTAGFAHHYFQHPDLARGADPNVSALWTWHAAEELEHKATAFDVYERLGGGYFGRVFTLFPAWAIILGVTCVNTLEMTARDRAFRLRHVFEALGYLFAPRKGLVTGLLPAFLAYLRPGFHPWEQDDSADIARWERENRKYVVSRATASELRARDAA
jgi:predicted metal-dependent hydrolase